MGKRGMLFLLVSVLALSFSLVYGQGLMPLSAGSTQAPAQDSTWQSVDATEIVLNGDSIAVEGDGVTVEGSTATIVAAGSYRVTGTLADGQVVVDTDDDGTVTVILAGAKISSSTSAPLVIADAEAAEVVLEAGTENTLSDATTYVFADPEEDKPSAALFSTSDLTISGSGALTVTGNYNDGIASKDGLTITGGTITVSAVDDGIRGKDTLVIEDGAITVAAGGDTDTAAHHPKPAQGPQTRAAGHVKLTAGGRRRRDAGHHHRSSGHVERHGRRRRDHGGDVHLYHRRRLRPVLWWRQRHLYRRDTFREGHQGGCERSNRWRDLQYRRGG